MFWAIKEFLKKKLLIFLGEKFLHKFHNLLLKTLLFNKHKLSGCEIVQRTKCDSHHCTSKTNDIVRHTEIRNGQIHKQGLTVDIHNLLLDTFYLFTVQTWKKTNKFKKTSFKAQTRHITTYTSLKLWNKLNDLNCVFTCSVRGVWIEMIAGLI